VSADQYMTPQELAEQLKVSVHTLRNWRHLGQGRGPDAVRISHTTVRYKRADVDRWLKQKKAAAS